jgi:transcriptional regulator with XRE-family HTH domain
MYNPVNIKIEMVKKGMSSVEELAVATGISAGALRSVLKGGNTTTATLEKIAQALGCSEIAFYLPIADSKLADRTEGVA